MRDNNVVDMNQERNPFPETLSDKNVKKTAKEEITHRINELVVETNKETIAFIDESFSLFSKRSVKINKKKPDIDNDGVSGTSNSDITVQHKKRFGVKRLIYVLALLLSWTITIVVCVISTNEVQDYKQRMVSPVIAASNYSNQNDENSYEDNFESQEDEISFLREALIENENEISDLRDELTENEIELSDLRDELLENEDELDFYRDYVAVILEDDTEYYHTYSCSLFGDDLFWLVNTDTAEVQGYNPCPYCH